MPESPQSVPPSDREPWHLDLLAFSICIGLLYFAKDFVVPVVLAGLLSFLLAPLNRRLERLGMSHVFAALSSTLLSFFVVGMVIYLVTTQAFDVAQRLPDYRANLIEKANSLRKTSEGPIGRAVQTIKDVLQSIDQPEPKAASGSAGAQPLPVKVVRSPSDAVASAGGMLGPIFSPLGTAAVVIVIAIFMMLGRDDLRDRIVQIVGRGRLRLTSHALDEAGKRVSRYLLAQLIVNVTYGIPIGIGLHFIGIPNAVLWGLLAFILRFLPYVGPWMAAVFPVILSIVVSSTWTTFALTVGLYVVVELISNNVVEPWLYGARTGLSPLAVVISAVFWTWLWGFPGLILATPLTVCLVVMGRHVPQLRWLDLLMGDCPPITGSDRLAHRLVAGDEEEASDLFQREMEERDTAVTAFDQVALPAAKLIESDFKDGLLRDYRRTSALFRLREIVNEFADALPLNEGAQVGVLCIPAQTLGDEVAAEMLEAGMAIHGVASECLSSRLTTGESISEAARLSPEVVCISVLCAESVVAAMFLCKHLRGRLPKSRIFVGLWHQEGAEFERRAARLEKVGAHRVLPSLERTIAAVLELLPERSG